MIQSIIQKLIEKRDLSSSEAESVMTEILSGECTPAQISGFLVALRMKGETVSEIASLVKSMRSKCNSISINAHPLLDTCGTGGDKKGTFNISTCSAFVVAGAGVTVAKHGNSSVSSACGSADVLKELGVKVDLSPNQLKNCIEHVGIGFMFAPLFHPAMKFASVPRKELGIRTVFNILGPLTNPANASHQLIGVYEPSLTIKVAKVFQMLGCKHVMVVHGNGLDEITIDGSTTIAEYSGGKVKKYTIAPSLFGMKKSTLEDIQSSSIADNALILTSILDGSEKGARRDVVLLNSAAALVVAGMAKSFKEGINLARLSIESGNAIKKLKDLVEYTNKT